MSAGDTIRVMSFNLRNSRAHDGDNAWPHRRDFVIKTIRDANVDLLGVQEALADQVDFLREQLTDYQHEGVARDDGARKGESCTVIFRTDRFDPIDAGTFWLSDTPTVIGSRGWDAQLPRIATWAHLRCRDSNNEILFLNTHFDHKGATARIESAKQIVRLIKTTQPVDRAIVVGDFNATENSPEYVIFAAAPFRDAWRLIHPRPIPHEGTYHAWTGERSRERIDWILCTAHFKVINCRVDYSNHGGRWPSDHFPLIADMALVK